MAPATWRRAERRSRSLLEFANDLLHLSLLRAGEALHKQPAPISGLCFFITLPSQEEEDIMEEKAKILINEDDQDVSEVMRVALEARQYRVDSATDPEQGLGKVRQWRPDLVILDVLFGRRQQAKGFEAAIRMRREP
jgi:PleD family two-component response regulator